ncbi:Probable 5'-nucleotidase precursor [Bordetella ansorpii]|uniref:Probable 5'-nucleotidase n=1 Tax=Bordetella ansorpii TaxID=288768 RepID=A0A157S5P5_9BORD|nr:5'-nucleotidase C-terminal domain-containing protein [Bordetella ansorpii]SAI65724.1 Probable 5'-nucleotidase precursor [Bordetella ansorpii]
MHAEPSFGRNGSESRWNHRLKVIAAALAAAGLVAACGGSDHDDDQATTPPVAGEPMDLTILHIDDHHSNLDAKNRTLNLKNAAGTRTAVSVEAAGFPRVTAAMKELSVGKTNVLKLHAGDALTGTLYYNRAGALGEADATMMNTVCFDAFTLGNHEFDKGDTELKGFIDRLHADDCQTPVISANVHFGENSQLNPSRAPGYVNPYTIVERSDQKIGIVGLTIATKTKNSSSPDADTTFEDETVAAQRSIDELKAQGINKIVVMSHIGYEYDKQVLANLSGVDVVVGGDSHTLLGPDWLTDYGVGTPAGKYAEQLADKDGSPVCLVHAWEYSQVVGELNVSFDKDGKVTNCGGTPHVLIDENISVSGATPSAADLRAMRDDIAASGFLRITHPDTAAAELLKPFKAFVDEFRAKEVAITMQELCRRRVPGTPPNPAIADVSNSSDTCNTEGNVALRGGDIQQYVAQAFLEIANSDYGGADISLQNGGGVRVALPIDTVTGRVTAADVLTVLPFSNMLWRLELTGAEVKTMVEDGLNAVFGTGGSTGPYPYTGGLRFDVNYAQAYGSRASNLEVRNRDTGVWEAIDPAKTYKLFTLSFAAQGGDGYKVLATIPAERREDIGVLDADAFQTYIDRQTVDSSTNLPVIERVDDALYSTKSFNP